MRRGAIGLGFKELVLIALAIVLLVVGVLLLFSIIGPAVEAGNVYSRG